MQEDMNPDHTFYNLGASKSADRLSLITQISTISTRWGSKIVNRAVGINCSKLENAEKVPCWYHIWKRHFKVLQFKGRFRREQICVTLQMQLTYRVTDFFPWIHSKVNRNVKYWMRYEYFIHMESLEKWTELTKNKENCSSHSNLWATYFFADFKSPTQKPTFDVFEVDNVPLSPDFETKKNGKCSVGKVSRQML